MKRLVTGLIVALPLLAARGAQAEPMFLSKQYARCTTCHFSPTGGGLLTPYGRSLSREELSTTGRGASGLPREHAFLGGALPDTGNLSLGLDVRPAHLDIDFPGGGMTRDFLMTADLLAAYRVGEWTLYGEIGRQPRTEGAKVDSYEYWIAHQSEKGFGVRAGRFLPAYGVRFADHTAFTRSNLGFDKYDQVFGLELSHAGARHLFQASAGPGRADSILDDNGQQAFTATGRAQFDFNPRTTLVLSGLFRAKSDVAARRSATGAAFGISPARRVNVWTEVDATFINGQSGAPSYNVVNETGVEVYRGVWLKFSPQLVTNPGDTSSGTFRTAFEVNLLPRTHWNLNFTYYHDKDRQSDVVYKTWLAQLHLYL
jgi:hypothetical protein